MIGHSSNLLGVPMELLVHRDFNDYPMPLHISGVREMNATLFEMLAQSSDLGDAGEAFTCYMMAMFGIDPEQREDGAGHATGARRRRYRSSFLRLIKGWGYDSNGPEGAVLKGWVESRFGIFPTFHKEVIRRISSRAWTTYVEEKMSSRFHSNSIYTQLDLLFEFCQWALARMVAPDRTHLTLYRGINAFDEHQLVERIDRRTARMRLNNLSSFTSHRDIATDSFSDCVIQAVNQGGDADTTGALAAMLAGATYGLAAVPARWLNQLDRTVAAEIRRLVPDLLAMSQEKS